MFDVPGNWVGTGGTEGEYQRLPAAMVPAALPVAAPICAKWRP
jgi:hypothetical protein